MPSNYSVRSDRLITPEKIKKNSFLNIKGKNIQGTSSQPASRTVIELPGRTVFPALVDAHDHLFGNYYPKIGNGKGNYINWKPWDDDLKSSPLYKERSKIPPLDIYKLACYKHVVTGCTTVNDHMPHSVNAPFLDFMPIRVQKKYCLAHECSSFDLRWGDGIVTEHERALKNDIPFITHIEEGFDPESKKGIDILLLLGALSRHTVLIHGIALSPEDIRSIASKKASMVWCPGSNWYMFKRTGDVKAWLKAGINVALGTDSPASGELNLLEEARLGRKLYKKIYKQDIPNKTLVEMMTINAAKALRLDNSVGSLQKGKAADFVAVRGGRKDAYADLVDASFADISLVFYNGKPLYGDAEFSSLFKDFGVKYKKVGMAGSDKIINGDPKGLMDRIRKFVGFKKQIPFLPVD